MEVRDASSAVYRVEPEAARADDNVPPGYKRTEVGVIPEDWGVKSLGEVVDFLDGLRRPVKDSDRAKMRGNIPYYGASGIVDYVDTFLFNEDLILLGEDGENILSRNCRLAFRVVGKCWINNHAHVLRPRAGASHGFLVEFLESINYAQYNTGTAQPKLNKFVCARIPVARPPFAEQQAIAEALSDADALIESLQQLIGKRRALKQGTMQALLTGRQRLPGFSDEWRTNQLGDLATFHKGKGLPKSALDDNGKFPCVHYGELFTRLPETIRETCSRTNWTGDTFRSFINDVLMPTSDVTPSGLAKASCVVMDGVIIGGDVLVIRTDPRIICGTFLSYVIRNSEPQILQLVTGTTVFHLYASDMHKFEFRVPPIAEQEAIITVLSDMDAGIEALEARLAKTRALKAGMMQQLLTGRIRLV